MNAKTNIQDVLKRFDELPALKDYSEDDKEFYTEIGNALLTNEIKSLTSKKQYALGVIIAATMLDHVGKVRLIWKYKDSIPEKEIWRLNLYNVAHLLFASNIINLETYHKINRVRRARNKVAHKLFRNLSSTQEENELVSVLKEAHEATDLLLPSK